MQELIEKIANSCNQLLGMSQMKMVGDQIHFTNPAIHQLYQSIEALSNTPQKESVEACRSALEACQSNNIEGLNYTVLYQLLDNLNQHISH